MNKLGHGSPSSRSTSNNQNRGRRQQQQQQQQRVAECGDSVQDRRVVAAQAHIRSPNLTREPSSVFESLSRNLRSFLPIRISGSPPAPRRRPLSFGGVIGAHTNVVPALTPSDEVQRVQGAGYQEGERITWAAWDELEHTRVLLLAYTSGFQVWDAGNLGAVRELLNLKTESLHNADPVLCAAVLPTPAEGTDEFESLRPLLGVLSATHLTICSLSTHSIVKQIPFTGAGTIVARPAFIVISTTHPHKLHILSSHTFSLLHSVSLAAPPVFSLSLRLLAYASPNPNPHTHGPLSPTFVSRTHDSLSSSVMRVGGEVWSGVKAAVATSAAGLGGTDTEHARGFSRSAPAASHVRTQWLHSHHDDAPDDIYRMEYQNSGWVTVVDLMPLLSRSSQGQGVSQSQGIVSQGQPQGIAQGITKGPRSIVCFAPFPPEPTGIAHLSFSSAVGATPILCVAPRDGQRVAVFQIRPGASGRAGAGAGRMESAVAEMPWHWYDLRRGVTSARVDNVVWEKAGRWVGVATGRRTVHVFPTNPYGGKPDERSHLEARVYNVLELQSLSTDITPLVRLRPTMTTAPPDVFPDTAPLAFMFLPQSVSLALPPSLLPHSSPSIIKTPATPPAWPSHSSPLSLSPVPGSGPRGASFQDILLFDPASGELALRRITLEWVAPVSDLGGYVVSVPGTTGYNVNFPVPMGMGRGRADVGERQGELVGKESVVATWGLKRGHEWAEVRGALPDAARPKSAIMSSSCAQSKGITANYLAQAELSTHSRSPAVLPRPIYLSHQFSFHALGEDYHALLRRSQFNVPCTQIEVRKDVEVSAYTGEGSDPFMHGAVEDLQRVEDVRDRRTSAAMRGSFDEPIASAMRSGLDYSGQSPPVLPMLPNGAYMSVLDTIPIHTKHVAAGVNEGLGRIRREIGKVRSPILRPTITAHGHVSPRRREEEDGGRHVPLEFDEEDEALFLVESDDNGAGGNGGGGDVGMDPEHDLEDHEGISRDDGSGSGASMSVSTPSSRFRADLSVVGAPGEDGEGMWDAWDDEARATIADAETFDEISATGFMDEEHVHAPIMAAMSRPHGKGRARRP